MLSVELYKPLFLLDGYEGLQHTKDKYMYESLEETEDTDTEESVSEESIYEKSDSEGEIDSILINENISKEDLQSNNMFNISLSNFNKIKQFITIESEIDSFTWSNNVLSVTLRMGYGENNRFVLFKLTNMEHKDILCIQFSINPYEIIKDYLSNIKDMNINNEKLINDIMELQREYSSTLHELTKYANGFHTHHISASKYINQAECEIYYEAFRQAHKHLIVLPDSVEKYECTLTTNYNRDIPISNLVVCFDECIMERRRNRMIFSIGNNGIIIGEENGIIIDGENGIIRNNYVDERNGDDMRDGTVRLVMRNNPEDEWEICYTRLDQSVIKDETPYGIIKAFTLKNLISNRFSYKYYSMKLLSNVGPFLEKKFNLINIDYHSPDEVSMYGGRVTLCYNNIVHSITFCGSKISHKITTPDDTINLAIESNIITASMNEYEHLGFSSKQHFFINGHELPILEYLKLKYHIEYEEPIYINGNILQYHDCIHYILVRQSSDTVQVFIKNIESIKEVKSFDCLIYDEALHDTDIILYKHGSICTSLQGSILVVTQNDYRNEGNVCTALKYANEALSLEFSTIYNIKKKVWDYVKVIGTLYNRTYQYTDKITVHKLDSDINNFNINSVKRFSKKDYLPLTLVYDTHSILLCRIGNKLLETRTEMDIIINIITPRGYMKKYISPVADDYMGIDDYSKTDNYINNANNELSLQFSNFYSMEIPIWQFVQDIGTKYHRDYQRANKIIIQKLNRIINYNDMDAIKNFSKEDYLPLILVYNTHTIKLSYNNDQFMEVRTEGNIIIKTVVFPDITRIITLINNVVETVIHIRDGIKSSIYAKEMSITEIQEGIRETLSLVQDKYSVAYDEGWTGKWVSLRDNKYEIQLKYPNYDHYIKEKNNINYKGSEEKNNMLTEKIIYKDHSDHIIRYGNETSTIKKIKVDGVDEITEVEYKRTPSLNGDGEMDMKINEKNQLKLKTKYSQLWEGGSYGYKAVVSIDGVECIAKLFIPEGVRVASNPSIKDGSIKMRSECAVVVAIWKLQTNTESKTPEPPSDDSKNTQVKYVLDELVTEGYSCVHQTDGGFTYTVGSVAIAKDFDPNLSSICVPGIHFVATSQEALFYHGINDVKIENIEGYAEAENILIDDNITNKLFKKYEDYIEDKSILVDTDNIKKLFEIDNILAYILEQQNELDRSKISSYALNGNINSYNSTTVRMSFSSSDSESGSDSDENNEIYRIPEDKTDEELGISSDVDLYMGGDSDSESESNQEWRFIDEPKDPIAPVLRKRK
uniref:Uncharacterized protein n=1 Tax=Pithovirus LCPAC101 TaxID=2506586 RepID=A0A481Z2J5_9VIRU|nr:MAG: hypothetical protein LCPAC101_01960 [Pithovirus LCPAC101]